MTRVCTLILFAAVMIAGMATFAPQRADARPWGYYRAPYVAAYRYPAYRPVVVAPRVLYRPVLPIGPVVPMTPYGAYPYPYRVPAYPVPVYPY